MNKPYLICKWITDEHGLHCIWIKVEASADDKLFVSTLGLQPIYKEVA